MTEADRNVGKILVVAGIGLCLIGILPLGFTFIIAGFLAVAFF